MIKNLVHKNPTFSNTVLFPHVESTKMRPLPFNCFGRAIPPWPSCCQTTRPPWTKWPHSTTLTHFFFTTHQPLSNPEAIFHSLLYL